MDITYTLLDIVDAIDEAIEKIEEMRDGGIDDNDDDDDTVGASDIHAKIKKFKQTQHLRATNSDTGDILYLKDIINFSVENLERVKKKLDVFYLDDM